MRTKIFITLLLSFLLYESGFTQKSIYYHATFQYAGSIGFVSAGGGFSNKSLTLEHDILYGNVPPSLGGEAHKISYKFSGNPFSAYISKRITWKIFNPGAFVSYNLGKGFSLRPNQSLYPPGYYWWSPGLRVHLSFNTALYIQTKKDRDARLMLYFETNTNDRYLTTYADNINKIPFTDIWFLGSGVKYIFDR